MICRISTTRVARAIGLASGVAIWALGLEQAQGSQGPGVMPGTATTAVQIAMAIAVYGGSAVLVAASLIAAAWRRKAPG